MNKKEYDKALNQAISKKLEDIQKNSLDALEFELYEKEFGINENFIRDIIAEDDWGFIIKAHTLIEAMFSSLITKHINANDGVKKVMTFLPLSDSQIGKLELAEYVLGLKKEHKKYIKRLSNIRNSFAHDIKYVSSNLNQYLANMDKQQQKAFLKDFAWIDVSRDLFMKEPRKCLTISFLMILFVIESMFSKNSLKELQTPIGKKELQTYKSQIETEKTKSKIIELEKEQNTNQFALSGPQLPKI
jgi:hypothetical protein